MSPVRSALMARAVSSSGPLRQPTLVLLASLLGAIIALQGI